MERDVLKGTPGAELFGDVRSWDHELLPGKCIVDSPQTEPHKHI